MTMQVDSINVKTAVAWISLGMLFNTVGKRHQEIMKNYTKMSCIEVAIRDENVGEISITQKGKLVVKKPFTDQDNKRKEDGLEVIKNILHAEGAKEIIQSPYYFGLHLMGKYVISTNGANAVVE